MTALGTLQMLLLAALLFVISAGLMCSLAVPHLVRWTAGWAPARRHQGLMLVALAPLSISLAALLSVILPSLLGLRWPVLDHCLEHAGHSHLCFVHSGPHLGGWAGWLVLAGALAWLGVRLAHGVQALVRAAQIIRRLSRSARYDSTRSLWVLPTDDTLCLSVGLLRPRLIASQGLLASASDDEIAIMLAHEEAHSRRKDSLVRLIARVASMPLLPAARGQLLSTLELASEQTCDEEAVLHCGDRLRVAETILAVERWTQAISSMHRGPMTSSFGASSVPQRVEAMLQPAREASSYPLLVVALVVVVACVLGAHDALHHTTESLLAAFSH